MAVSHIHAMQSVLQQMRAISHIAQSVIPPAVSLPRSEDSFATVLQHSLQDVAHTQNQASAQAKAFVAGKPGIALNDVMLDLQKANVAFQTTVQVRNRLVAAYQEIANLAV